jgi:hypothetical protein
MINKKRGKVKRQAHAREHETRTRARTYGDYFVSIHEPKGSTKKGMDNTICGTV